MLENILKPTHIVQSQAEPLKHCDIHSHNLRVSSLGILVIAFHSQVPGGEKSNDILDYTDSGPLMVIPHLEP